ncbi:MAG: hypothetical protein WBP44_11985, partial [Gammaproteobacteria bacterium]
MLFAASIDILGGISSSRFQTRNPARGVLVFRGQPQAHGSQEDRNMKKLFIGNLPPDATEESVREMFSAFGTVR